MIRKQALTLALLAVLLSVALTACGGNGGSGPATGGIWDRSGWDQASWN